MKKIIVRIYLFINIFFIKYIVLEGIFDNIDFKGETTANSNTTSKAQISTSTTEIRKNSSNSTKNISSENNSTNQEQPKKKMLIIKKEDPTIKNAFDNSDVKEVQSNEVNQDMNLNGAEIETIQETKEDYNDYNDNNY